MAKNTPILFLAQSIFWLCTFTGISFAALAGAKLTPIKALATLPLTLQVLTALVSIKLISVLMRRTGRTPALVGGAVLGAVGGLIAAYGIYKSSFSLFCLGVACLGVFTGSAGYYRHAALDSVPNHLKARITSIIISGGLVGALVGPYMTYKTEKLFSSQYAGSYLAIAFLALLNALLLAALKIKHTATTSSSTGKFKYNKKSRAAMLFTATGHGMMILGMNATPLAMQYCGFDIVQSVKTMQWHVIAMFGPSFFTSQLMSKFGAYSIARAGLVFLIGSVAFAATSASEMNFILSTICLGVGWNLLMSSGTVLLNTSIDDGQKIQGQSSMELGNGLSAVLMSLLSGALLQTMGWEAVNIFMLPFIIFTLIYTKIIRSEPGDQDSGHKLKSAQ